jgi:hypothetical protein
VAALAPAAAAAASAPCAAPLVPRMQSINVAEAVAPAAKLQQMVTAYAGAQNAGIHAMELYTPNHSVDQVCHGTQAIGSKCPY